MTFLPADVALDVDSDRRHVLAVLAVSDRDEFFEKRPDDMHHRLLEVVGEHLADALQPDEQLWHVLPDDGELVLLLPAGRTTPVRRRLQDLAHRLSAAPFVLDDGTEHAVDVGVGWADIARGAELREVFHEHARATAAARDALRQRDLMAKKASSGGDGPRPTYLRTWFQVATTVVVGLVLPFLLMVGAYQVGLDVSPVVYWVVVAALFGTAAMLWTEALRALDPARLPSAPEGPAPPATAIVAAYLPNESATILETLGHFLEQDYPGDLQVLLAYNSPERLAVEDDLERLAAVEPRLTLHRVPDSTSKAQNVNAALGVATGEFVGIFDADHHPMPGSFRRAWQWIADGADVVQGHCAVRNGEQSLIARTVAVEFEQIYAVSHPGRTAMHGFGIFGGSNGFWRTSVLRRIRLRGDRLTEDIDSSVRATLAGYRIETDPGLVSRELAPVSAGALWRQRLRWSQGWFQVSTDLLGTALRSRVLNRKQRFGMGVLLGWREIYPWIAALPLPLLAFIAWRDGSVEWSSPLFLLTTLYTLASGPLQVLMAWRLAVPELRTRPWWFVGYLLLATVAYNEAKNLAVKVAQLKQLTGERHWAVTPRSVEEPTDQIRETLSVGGAA